MPPNNKKLPFPLCTNLNKTEVPLGTKKAQYDQARQAFDAIMRRESRQAQVMNSNAVIGR